MNDQTRRNATISATINGNTLALMFANGETLTMRGDALNSDVQQYAMMHGLKQKLVDALFREWLSTLIEKVKPC